MQYINEIKIDGNEYISIENTNPREISNVQVYAGNAVHECVFGVIYEVVNFPNGF